MEPVKYGKKTGDTYYRIYLYRKWLISIKISLKFVSEGPINKKPALGGIMACHQTCDGPYTVLN